MGAKVLSVFLWAEGVRVQRGGCSDSPNLPSIWRRFAGFQMSGPARTFFGDPVGWLKVSGPSGPDICGRYGDPHWSCPCIISYFCSNMGTLVYSWILIAKFIVGELIP